MSTAAGFIEAAWTMVRLRRYAAADELFVRALMIEPNNVSALGGRAVAINGQGHHAAAIDMAWAAVAAAPTASWPRYILGWLNENQERWADAIKHFDQALKLDPHNSDAWRERAHCRYCLNNFSAAISDARESLRLYPEKAESMNTLGLSLFYGGHRDEGLATLRRCRELHPDNASAHANIGFCLQAMELHREAAESFDRALRLRPDEQRWLAPMLKSARLARWWLRMAESNKGESLFPVVWLVFMVIFAFDALQEESLSTPHSQEAFVTVLVANFFVFALLLTDWNTPARVFLSCVDPWIRRLTPWTERSVAGAIVGFSALGACLALAGASRGLPGVAWLAIPTWMLAFAARSTQYRPAARVACQVSLCLAGAWWLYRGLDHAGLRLWTLGSTIVFAALANRLSRLRRRLLMG